MDVGLYLERIAYGKPVHPDGETLRSLAIAHQLTVPFENLDNHFGVPIILDIDSIYRKIVHRRRGGACFELNATFGTLLRRIGFHVEFLEGRVFNSNTEGRAFDHLFLRVLADGAPYMVDVGFGDGFYQSIEFRDGAHAKHGQQSCQLQVFKERGLLETWRGDKFDKGLDFSLQPRALTEFSKMNRYHTWNPRSLRSWELVVTRATPTGRLSMVGRRRTRRDTDSTKSEVVSDAKYLEILRADFGIDVPYIPTVRASRLYMRLIKQGQTAVRRIQKLYRVLTGSNIDNNGRSISERIDQ